jgi:hypothetical protein
LSEHRDREDTVHTFVLQDWVSLKGSGTTNIVVQGADQWLDMTPYQDIQFWLDVRQLTLTGGTTPALNMSFETAPAKDDALFTSMVAQFAMVAGSGPSVYQALLTNAAVPIARWLRWRLIPVGSPPPSAFDVTFRIVLSANSPGT